MQKTAERYVPAMGVDWLIRLYDPLCRWILGERAVKQRLVELADLRPGQRALDVGCGTGTLALMLAEAQPEAEIVGLDGDPRALAIARGKPCPGGKVSFDEGMSFALPYPDASFDRATSSLMLHHLTTANRERTLREIARVLRPGGGLAVLDFGVPGGGWGGFVAKLLHRDSDIADNLEGRLPEMIRAAGFDGGDEVGRHGTVFGSLSYYRGVKTA